MPQSLTVWLSADDLEAVQDDIKHRLPNESGGMIFGYWADHLSCVIKAFTMSGPEATHGPVSFRPDYTHDEHIAAQIWEDSQGTHNYLGDWHSHPNTKRPYLSIKDRITLDRITDATRTNARPGLSMVFAANVNEIAYDIWFGLVLRFLGLKIPTAFKCRTILF